MKLLFYTVVLAAAVCQTEALFHDRKILISKLAGKTRTLAELSAIQKQIRDKTLANLYALPAAVKTDLLHVADQALADKTGYPVKTAYDYMEYYRNGNRGRYEGKLSAHRRRIGTLVVGQLLDEERNKSSTKYLNEIVNGVWIGMEESTWCWPAHINYLPHNVTQSLPSPNQIVVDLGAGEMAKIVAWVKLVMADKFDQVSKVINQRIDYELNRRIYHDFLVDNRFVWEAFGGHHGTGNWNIWINSNILKSALYTLQDVALFNRVLNKTLYSVDYFLDSYGDDGGCDEGPDYWRHAGGRLAEYLEAVEYVLPEAKQYLKTVKLIQSIGAYSYKMLIGHNWFVNFADASAHITYPPTLLAMYGQMFDDEPMKQYAGYMFQLQKASSNMSNYFNGALGNLNEFFNAVNMHTEIESYKPAAPSFDLVWFPDIQVVNGRTKTEGSKLGFFVAAKAGTNHENHNHNDVGNFILFQNGLPVLIDIGAATYTITTFGPHRYEHYNVQSQYHNCPTINGVPQKAGSEFSAHNATFKEVANNGGFIFSADIAGVYPKESHAKHWIRTIHFDRVANEVQLQDQYQLDRFVAAQQLHFITVKDTVITKTETGLALKQANVSVAMDMDWKVFDYSVEVRSLDNDHRLTNVWGDHVQRITLTTNAAHKELNGHFTVKFSQLK